MDEKIVVKKKFNTSNFVLGAVLSLISLAYIYPIFMVLINALKKSNKITTDAMFKLPTSETFTGWTNFKTAIETNKFFQSFGVSLLITVTSVAAIIIFCSMCAWFITRVKGFISSFYLLYVCIFDGCSIPDGYAYTFVYSNKNAPQLTMDYMDNLSGIWCRSGGIYVCRIYENNSYGNRGSSND